MRRIALITLAMLLPGEAHTSGSSTVRAVGANLAVIHTSVRKIFARGEGESEWHSDWKSENQPRVDEAARRLGAVLDGAAAQHALSLAPYSEDLPQAWSWVPPDDDRSPEQVCTTACRVRLHPWEAAQGTGVPPYEVEIAVSAAPSREAIAAINAAFASALVPAVDER